MSGSRPIRGDAVRERRRAHLATKDAAELRDIVAAERTVPLDHEIAEIAQEILDERKGTAS